MGRRNGWGWGFKQLAMSLFDHSLDGFALKLMVFLVDEAGYAIQRQCGAIIVVEHDLQQAERSMPSA